MSVRPRHASTGGKCAIFWDLDGTAIPPAGMSIGQAVEALRAFGVKHGELCEFKAYISPASESELSQATIRLAGDLQQCGVTLSLHKPAASGAGGRKEYIQISDMMVFVLDHGSMATIILVSNEHNLGYPISLLRNRLFEVIVLCPGEFDHYTPKHMRSLDAVWEARDDGAVTPVPSRPASSFAVARPASQAQRRPSSQLQHPFKQGQIEQPVTRSHMESPVSQTQVQRPVSQAQVQHPISQTQLQRPNSQVQAHRSAPQPQSQRIHAQVAPIAPPSEAAGSVSGTSTTTGPGPLPPNERRSHSQDLPVGSLLYHADPQVESVVSGASGTQRSFDITPGGGRPPSSFERVMSARETQPTPASPWSFSTAGSETSPSIDNHPLELPRAMSQPPSVQSPPTTLATLTTTSSMWPPAGAPLYPLTTTGDSPTGVLSHITDSPRSSSVAGESFPERVEFPSYGSDPGSTGPSSPRTMRPSIINPQLFGSTTAEQFHADQLSNLLGGLGRSIGVPSTVSSELRLPALLHPPSGRATGGDSTPSDSAQTARPLDTSRAGMSYQFATHPPPPPPMSNFPGLSTPGSVLSPFRNFHVPPPSALAFPPVSVTTTPGGNHSNHHVPTLEDKAAFQTLIRVLERFRAMGTLMPLRSAVGSELRQLDPKVYEKAGVKTFKEYSALAEKKGIVELIGGSPGKEKITIGFK